MKVIGVMSISLLLVLSLFGQGVSLEYQQMSMAHIFLEIESKYKVQFSYSQDRINVERVINVSIDALSIEDALNILFDEQNIAYRKVGEVYVLKDAKKRKKRREKRPTKEEVVTVVEIKPVIPVREATYQVAMLEEAPISFLLLDPLEVHQLVVDSTSGEAISFRQSSVKEWLNYNLTPRTAKVDIVPGLSTEHIHQTKRKKNVSLNVLWGVTDTVVGVEVGGLYNNVLNDMTGVQVAGLVNSVNGDLVGTQVSGLFNSVKGSSSGAQIAGLKNSSNESGGVVQVSGLLNASSGRTYTQISGVSNIGDDVDVQVSGLYNKADRVRKLQIGLINVADTIEGVSIGLVNVVKKGYNRFELYYDETMYFNGVAKLGADRFHTIIKAGYSPINPDYYRWGVGMGFGSRLRLGYNSGLNIDLTATHVNENEAWESRLNLVNTLAVTFSHKLFGRTELFVGPSYNVYVFKNQDFAEGDFMENYFLDDYKWTIFDNYKPEDLETNRTTVIKWIGFRAGIRF